MRLLIAGGGTGGHLYPGVAVAEELLSRGPKHLVRFAGSAQGIEARVLPGLNLPFTPVRCGALVGKAVTDKVRGLGLAFAGIADARRLIQDFRPDACLGVGGYASFPVAVAARLSGVFLAIQEQNATPGLANRALSKLAQRVYASDEAAAGTFPAEKTVVTGTPLRNSLKAAFLYEMPSTDRPTRILVLGGSQGARSINQWVPEALSLLTYPVEVRHQAGRDREDAVREAYGNRPGVTVEGFIEDMAAAYEWAQIVVARSGALTLAELAATGRPAILIPFPHAAGDHQTANARAVEKRKAAVCLLEKDFRPDRLARLVSRWIEEPALAAATAKAAADGTRRDSAARIVDDLIAAHGRRK
jgi:UDP-N-acetylglucosamine--N-acetylmuramyl-(pentapeptide) pyrophosphoryl-undecaprenol N-acetylglucosamine transferase